VTPSAFAMATLSDAIVRAAKRLALADVPEARAEARRLVALATGRSPESMVAAPRQDLPPEALKRIDAVVARRATREPFAYIAGVREFWSLPFRVTRATLIPRPDTETVVEAALAHVRAAGMAKPRILDLGTGSGCILLALLSELPDATGLGVDASAEALSVASQNAVALGLESRVAFHLGNWTDRLTGSFDVIVSNPPYIPDADVDALEPEVARYEPRSALAGGGDGLSAYRAIVAGAVTLLSRNGVLLLEIGAGQASDVAAIVEGAGLDVIGVRTDLSGIPRCVMATRRKN